MRNPKVLQLKYSIEAAYRTLENSKTEEAKSDLKRIVDQLDVYLNDEDLYSWARRRYDGLSVRIINCLCAMTDCSVKDMVDMVKDGSYETFQTYDGRKVRGFGAKSFFELHDYLKANKYF